MSASNNLQATSIATDPTFNSRFALRALVDRLNQRFLTRREALAALGGSVVLLTGCGSEGVTAPSDYSDGRLRARPSTPTIVPPTGITQIPLTVGVDGLMFVPKTYKASSPVPVAMLFHGAGGDASELIGPISTYAESRGLVLVAVTSTQGTWDAIQGVFGSDVRSADATLDWLFARIAVDRSRLGIMGFSDGATYSLAIARANGDLFRRATVYSPGFLIPVTSVGKPEFFITHGTQDRVLSFDNTQNVIVPTLRANGYSVEFHQWDGGHGVPADLLEESVDWFVRT